jgi:hypothetical protein
VEVNKGFFHVGLQAENNSPLWRKSLGTFQHSSVFFVHHFSRLLFMLIKKGEVRLERLKRVGKQGKKKKEAGKI